LGSILQASFLAYASFLGDILYRPEDSGRNPMVTADRLEKGQRKTGQGMLMYPACIGCGHGEVHCEFLGFLFKTIRVSQRNAATAVLPQQRSPPAVAVTSAAVVWVCAAPDFKHFHTQQAEVSI